MDSSSSSFRQDIQILRGIAILQVLCYHLGFSFAKSGFLGVDIFFVISGYLMAQIYNPLEVRLFFIKRARRLLPSYFAVLAVVLVAGYFITNPNEFRQLSQQIQSSLLFSSNLVYWSADSYFQKATFKPLLSMWSFAIEIQFYLCVPLFSKIQKKSRFLLPFIMFLSIILCFSALSISPKTAFYLLPFRVWEFLAGFLIFQIGKNRVRFFRNSIAQYSAIVILIAISTVRLDGDSTNPINGHPGLLTLVVVIVTSIFLLGEFKVPMRGKFVALFFEKVGEYSYVLYLVHFPVIVLIHYVPFGGTDTRYNSITELSVILFITIILTLLIHKYVEKPFRYRRYRIHHLAFINALLLIASLLVTSFQLSRLTIREQYVSTASTDRSPYRCGKLIRVLDPFASMCKLTPSYFTERDRVLLLGNSHADAIKTAFAEVAQENQTSVFFWAQNDPLAINGASIEDIIIEVLRLNIGTVVLHFSPGTLDNSRLQSQVRLLLSQDIKVIVLEPVPVWPGSIPAMMWDNLKGIDQVYRQNYDFYMQQNSSELSKLSSIIDSNYMHFSTASYFCKPNCKFASEIGKPYYFDPAHLTLTGSRVLIPLFKKVLEVSRVDKE